MEKTRDKVLLVGGAGYIGSALARELLQRGYAVRVFDRLFYGDMGIREFSERLQVVVGDMRHMPKSLLDDVRAVVNVGGLSNDPTAEFNPQANYEMNTLATETLARLCKERGVRRYLFASSCSIYDVGVHDQERDVIYDETAAVQPRAAYAVSKYEGEQRLLELADKEFCPVILRKGTVYGFSPRMRYDLVLNTFVKDAFTKGHLTIHYGGEMWRPLVDVRDVARAYIACLDADENLVRNQIFNVVHSNLRVSELALRVQSALRTKGINVEIRPDYRYHGVRSYRVNAEKINRVLGWRPTVSVEEAVIDLAEKIRAGNCVDFENPRYYNIAWLKLLEEADRIIRLTGFLLTSPNGGEVKSPRVVQPMERQAAR
ncbi:MAG: NAD(P)-dependent oxidoreductase [Acidobacteria bacterium]|nr:NAD(P)-dependent oxidoreductase [Acidobacteriota bacterium]